MYEGLGYSEFKSKCLEMADEFLTNSMKRAMVDSFDMLGESTGIQSALVIVSLVNEIYICQRI